MPGPTPAQIKTVQQNLSNMIDFNDHVHSFGQDRINNAFFLLTEKDSTDPGLAVGLILVESAFRGIGAIAGPIGTFVSSFAAGMVNFWANQTPPSLNGTFSSYLTRFSKTSQQVDTQLAEYHQDPAKHWDTSFTYQGKKTTLADLASGDFPAKTDPAFQKAATAAVFALDQDLWTTVMKAKLVVTRWELSSGPTIFPGKKSDPPVAWAQSFYAKNPAYRETWSWHDSSGCGDTTGWLMEEYNLGTGAGVFTDGSIAADACHYLFQDSTPGKIINKDGLFTREKVFTGLGIRHTTHIVPVGGGFAQEKLSMGYLRAMRESRTLGALIEREGREAVERRVVERAHADPVFAHDLARRPRATLEGFLDIKIPEAVALSIVVENPRTFGLVIPAPAAGGAQGGGRGSEDGRGGPGGARRRRRG